ncbi:alpha-amylase [Pseudobutyrivibrio sp. YE44]|uniref:alpha-amylase family glycosyl hydrolase n=1 Tax=Pseudobutyrivibrio sp. YE44 TaxID=1520802 RepID=UPI000886D7F6|nr:alpha-amylase family glycosyl hydrolase [Pseudobutyrivibrio sp. YE44]SDB47155.1 alpha-amylase [Pseudobutyrivibrio sp. YE44]
MLNKGFTRKVLSLALASGIVVTGVAANAPVVNAASVNDYGVQANIKDGNILHCFDWTYQQIIDELPNIAKAGFTSVQTSPAQAANSQNGTWYYLYQPAGFRVGDAGLGSEEDLKRLCSAADEYDIKVIVDVVANHLAGDHNTSIDDEFKNKEYWHNNVGPNGKPYDIHYNIRHEIVNNDIGMPDLNSEHPFVQQKVKSYVQQLKADGVDGIRWDAAKHISLPSEGCNFWRTVIDPTMFNYGEILDTPVENNPQLSNSLMSEYTDYMAVTDSGYSNGVTQSIRDGKVPTGYGNWTLVSGIEDSEVVYFGETHDTYSNEPNHSWSKYLNQNIVDRGYAIVASKANARALYFSRPFETNKENIKIGKKGSDSFKHKEVAAVNKLHNLAVGQSEYYSTDDNVAIVSRKIGATLVNCNSNCSNRTVSVKNPGGHLEAGQYKDEVTGNTFTVTSSTISGEIGSTGIAVLLKDENGNGGNGGNGGDNGGNGGDEQVTQYTIYFSNNKGWNDVYAYTWKDDKGTVSWPGKKMEFVKTNEFGESIYKLTIPSDIDGLIFTDNNGNQTADITSGFANNTGYYISGGNGNKLSVGTYNYK